LSSFSWPFFASVFNSFFPHARFLFPIDFIARRRNRLRYLPVTMGPHMGSTQRAASISFLGVTFLISCFSLFLMGLPPYVICQAYLSAEEGRPLSFVIRAVRRTILDPKDFCTDQCDRESHVGSGPHRHSVCHGFQLSLPVWFALFFRC
jgi:hypothetical protein